MSADRFRYEIDDTLTLRIWDLENPNELNAPFLLQPYSPVTGEAWKDMADVVAWTESFIEDMNRVPEPDVLDAEIVTE